MTTNPLTAKSPRAPSNIRGLRRFKVQTEKKEIPSTILRRHYFLLIYVKSAYLRNLRNLRMNLLGGPAFLAVKG
jgi:hypothetical protein